MGLITDALTGIGRATDLAFAQDRAHGAVSVLCSVKARFTLQWVAVIRRKVILVLQPRSPA